MYISVEKIEFQVLQVMANYIGYDNHDGVFCPGGSMANLYGMHLARHQQFPTIKVKKS